jgi:hypothetical protein
VCGSSAPTHLAHGYRVRTGRRWTQAASMLVSMNHQRVLSDAAGHAAPRSEESADDPAVTGAAGMTYEMSSPSSTRARACRRLISCPFSHVETVPRPTPSIAANSACVSWRRIRRCRIASARLMRFHVRRMCDEPYMNRRTHVKHESCVTCYGRWEVDSSHAYMDLRQRFTRDAIGNWHEPGGCCARDRRGPGHLWIVGTRNAHPETRSARPDRRGLQCSACGNRLERS